MTYLYDSGQVCNSGRNISGRPVHTKNQPNLSLPSLLKSGSLLRKGIPKEEKEKFFQEKVRSTVGMAIEDFGRENEGPTSVLTNNLNCQVVVRSPGVIVGVPRISLSVSFLLRLLKSDYKLRIVI